MSYEKAESATGKLIVTKGRKVNIDYGPLVVETAVDEEATITGNVTDIHGVGVPNVDVSLLVKGKEIAKATTDPKGKFELTFTYDKVGEHTFKLVYGGAEE